MDQKRPNSRLFIAAGLMTAMQLVGCATATPPTDLARPARHTCVDVQSGVEAHEVRGLVKFHWTIRLAAGPYVAEREDAEGTYYRAPSGGIYIGRDDLADKPPIELMPRTFDGGIWLPRVPGKPPHIYTYVSTAEAMVVPSPIGASCSNAVLVPHPQARGVNAVAFATGGLVGGAVGGAAGRAAAPNSSMSYGQSVGVGAAGGLIGGLIVAGLINMDVGKILHHRESTDPRFNAALEGLTRKVVAVRETAVPGGAVANATPSPMPASTSAARTVVSNARDVNDINAIAANETCREEYRKYVNSPPPKAFALTSKGACAWQRTRMASRPEISADPDPAVRALALCRTWHGQDAGCGLYAVDGKVVWTR